MNSPTLGGLLPRTDILSIVEQDAPCDLYSHECCHGIMGQWFCYTLVSNSLSEKVEKNILNLLFVMSLSISITIWYKKWHSLFENDLG